MKREEEFKKERERERDIVFSGENVLKKRNKDTCPRKGREIRKERRVMTGDFLKISCH